MDTSEIIDDVLNENSDLEKTYKHNVTFYLVPPNDEVTLDEFQELAVDRLKVLRILERASGIAVRMYSKEWKEKITAELNEEGVKGYARLLCKAEAQRRSDLEARKRDYLSHFIMRLVYCNNPERARWFVTREVELFKLKLLDSTDNDIRQFIELNDLEYEAITVEERNDIREGLNDSTMGMDVSKIDLVDIYKVPFLEVLDLTKSRRCYLKSGYAYVTSTDFISVLVTKHQKILEEGLKFAVHLLSRLEDDERFTTLMKNLHSSHTGKDYAVVKNAAIPIESIDQLSKKSFPLCMRFVHDELRTKHHLKHGGRMQYGLFLKGIGVTLEDSLRFWREEFIKTMDPEKFDKQYSYNIRHNYGKAGSMRDYTPYSCQKIINVSVGPMEVHGCPYKILESNILMSRLSAYGIGIGHVQEIVNLSSKGHYQLACGRYFEVTHDNAIERGINHPNNYFDVSQEIMENRGEKAVTIKQNKLKNPAPKENVINSQLSTQSTQDSQLDSSMFDYMLNTPMDFDDVNTY